MKGSDGFSSKENWGGSLAGATEVFQCGGTKLLEVVHETVLHRLRDENMVEVLAKLDGQMITGLMVDNDMRL